MEVGGGHKAMNWQRNPFTLGIPVPSDDLFIDRQRELDRLVDSVSDLEVKVVLIDGARRIGKSSLLQRFQRKIAMTTLAVDMDIQDLLIAHSTPVAYEVASHTVLLEFGKKLRKRVGLPDISGAMETAQEFQDKFLLPALAASRPRRVAVLLDELDVLVDRYPAAIEEILLAFRTGIDQALVVCCCGRPLGAPRSDRLAHLLKGAITISLRPFDKETTKAWPDSARNYRFTRNARSLLWEITRGHPLWTTAINNYVYSERKREDQTTKVRVSELQRSLEPAIGLITTHMWEVWRQLGPMQSLLARAVADLTWNADDQRFIGGASLSQIELELRPFFSHIEGDHLRKAAQALLDNHVLDTVGNGYRLYAPFLGYWLRQQEKTELRLAGDPQAVRRLDQAREHRARGDTSSALIAVNDALSFDPENTDGLIMAAEFAADSGNLDSAVWRLETAARSQPETVKLRLSEVLRRRIELAARNGESPDPWYYKLIELVPEEEAHSQGVIHAMCVHHLKRWEKHIRAGAADASRSEFEDLARRSLPGWRRVAAKKYDDVVRSLLHAQDGLSRCVAAVGQTFPILMDEPIEPIHPDQPGYELELLSQLEGDTISQEKLRRYFERQADLYPSWTSTLSVIELVFRSGNDDSQHWLSLSTVERILNGAPESHRRKLLEIIINLLPGRFSGMLRHRPAEVAHAIRLLFECAPNSSDKTSAVVQAAFESFLSEVIDSSDEGVVEFYRRVAPAYLIWAEFVGPGSQFVESIADHVELLIGRMKEPKGPVPPDCPQWELFIRGGEALDEWKSLLGHQRIKSERAALLAQSLVLPEEIAEAIRVPSLGASPRWDNVKTQLDHRYQNVRPLEIHIPGIPSEMVKFYRARWSGEEVNLKVYRLSITENSREFLTSLWEKEKRALMNLSTRLSGRALTRFKFSEQLVADKTADSPPERFERKYLVIITEAAGPRTLRDHLKERGRSGILDPTRRRELWQAIHALIECVSALHRAHYLHRSIRPENIFVQDAEGNPHFKLGNFEWSLYLHSMADEFPRDEERWVDRYTAPEVLARRFNKSKRDVGEGFSSEVYSLGLVLFELLVRRLTDEEIGRYYRGSDYDERAHQDWLHGLRAEVLGLLSDHEQKDERLLLREMLEPNVALRRSDLDDLVQLTATIAWDSREIEQLLSEHKPYVTTSLDRRTLYSIEHFLEPLLKTGELGSTEADLRRAVEREIAGARVYRNSGNPDQPLIIEGRRVLFTATPFVHGSGRKRGAEQNIPAVPFLSVARALDRKEGSPIAKLPMDLRVVDLTVVHKDLNSTHRQIVQKGEAWRRLFEMATIAAGRLPHECREFYTILQVTAEVEEQLWRQQVSGYQLFSKTQESGRLVVVVKRDEGPSAANLQVDRMVAQQTTRGERFFELSSNDSPLAPLQPQKIWKLEKVDTAKGMVQLSREGGEWPVDTGFVRPQGLAGNRAIRQRRTETLLNLRDDEYLLKAVTTISAVQEKLPVSKLKYFDAELDEDKRRIIKDILATPPLYLVQGPPGTGKTTLAAEVIRQVLEANPSARILVTSQAHEPLNNLLVRVHEAFEGVDPLRRPAAVRIFSSARLQSKRWTKETSKVMKDFQPAEVAKLHIQIARSWQPARDSGVDPELLAKWRTWLDAHIKNLPGELEQKIVASANLVYVTANDRSIAEVPEHREFDLLIFEEAAKAYPLEVLGPMRLSRHWLLIGDHEQLSAFNIDEFRSEASAATGRLYDMASGMPSRNPQPSRTLGLVSGSSELATKIADFFEYLFNKGIRDEAGRGFADRLSLQWRMHPLISGMMREVYYGFLKDGDADSLRLKHKHRILKPDEFRGNSLIWIDMPLASVGGLSRRLVDEDLTAEVPFSGGGFRNPFEARVLHNLMSRIHASGRGGLASDVAFLSPYKAQVDLINTFFRSWEGPRNPQTGDLRQKAYTVDSFQGRQAEVVAVSLVRNNGAASGFDAYGFLEGEEGKSRAAVMFSRAERLLIILGCSKHFTKQAGFHIGRVFEFVQQHGLVIDAKHFLQQKDYEELRKHKDRHETRPERDRLSIPQ